MRPTTLDGAIRDAIYVSEGSERPVRGGAVAEEEDFDRAPRSERPHIPAAAAGADDRRVRFDVPSRPNPRFERERPNVVVNNRRDGRWEERRPRPGPRPSSSNPSAEPLASRVEDLQKQLAKLTINLHELTRSPIEANYYRSAPEANMIEVGPGRRHTVEAYVQAPEAYMKRVSEFEGSALPRKRYTVPFPRPPAMDDLVPLDSRRDEDGDMPMDDLPPPVVTPPARTPTTAAPSDTPRVNRSRINATSPARATTGARGAAPRSKILGIARSHTRAAAAATMPTVAAAVPVARPIAATVRRAAAPAINSTMTRVTEIPYPKWQEAATLTVDADDGISDIETYMMQAPKTPSNADAAPALASDSPRTAPAGQPEDEEQKASRAAALAADMMRWRLAQEHYAKYGRVPSFAPADFVPARENAAVMTSPTSSGDVSDTQEGTASNVVLSNTASGGLDADAVVPSASPPPEGEMTTDLQIVPLIDAPAAMMVNTSEPASPVFVSLLRHLNLEPTHSERAEMFDAIYRDDGDESLPLWSNGFAGEPATQPATPRLAPDDEPAEETMPPLLDASDSENGSGSSAEGSEPETESGEEWEPNELATWTSGEMLTADAGAPSFPNSGPPSPRSFAAGFVPQTPHVSIPYEIVEGLTPAGHVKLALDVARAAQTHYRAQPAPDAEFTAKLTSMLAVLSDALRTSQDKLSKAQDRIIELEAAYTRRDGEYAALSAVNARLGNSNVVMGAKLRWMERQYRASSERVAELTNFARNLEQYWGNKLKYSVGQFGVAVRGAVAVGSFALLLNTLTTETPAYYTLEDPASINKMISAAAALVYRLSSQPHLASAVRRLLGATSISTCPGGPIVSRVPHYADLQSEEERVVLQPFHLAIRHAMVAGAEVTRHLAYTAASVVTQEAAPTETAALPAPATLAAPPAAAAAAA
ncbi:hypothetical protein HYH02_015372 [Chlamydomonas schloesseri]|uniref:Uncharacterized protein n=1 Tax=Chlamydomonas schloesseri TaxID=2026947 RepID=A0A835VN66_9CHLO|nr:hypothetical protein HYH02_015372 [Chlamydomonas schloesseri]|eukprot:KAG2423027.1 hypothetical protein HYH02_015372 [Chlamydomonas schloesseri]